MRNKELLFKLKFKFFNWLNKLRNLKNKLSKII